SVALSSGSFVGPFYQHSRVRPNCDFASLASEASRLADGVAGAADGADHVGQPVEVHRLAQPPDMHVHRALVDIERLAPDLVEKLAAREDAAGMLHQEFEQAELGRSQLQLGLAAMDAVGLAVEHE